MVQVVLLVVEDGKTGLVIELLKALHSKSAWVVHIVELARFQSFVVVGLSLTSNPRPVKNLILKHTVGKSQTILVLLFYSNGPAPECELAWDVGWRDSLVPVRPEPGNMISDVQYFLEMLDKSSVDLDIMEILEIAIFLKYRTNHPLMLIG